MSVYQFDLIRTDKELASKILKAVDKYSLKEDTLLCVRMKDDSIVLSWETWHGSPFPDFAQLLTDNRHKWLYAAEYDDGTAMIYDHHSDVRWRESLDIVKVDGIENIQIKEFGEEISAKSIMS